VSESQSSRLYISLYLDEDVSALIAKLLRARGFAAMTTLEAGRIGTSDADQLEFATGRGMALLTHNRVDFEKLAAQYAASGEQQHCGMILAARRPVYELARKLLMLVNRVAADEMDNLVLYI